MLYKDFLASESGNSFKISLAFCWKSFMTVMAYSNPPETLTNSMSSFTRFGLVL